jgi:hypothetical protein
MIKLNVACVERRTRDSDYGSVVTFKSERTGTYFSGRYLRDKSYAVAFQAAIGINILDGMNEDCPYPNTDTPLPELIIHLRQVCCERGHYSILIEGVEDEQH